MAKLLTGCLYPNRLQNRLLTLKTKMMDKFILDPCCGSRMMYYDKDNPHVLFGDIRSEEHILCDGRLLQIRPDMSLDVTNMPFADKSFKVVAFDPPHLASGGDKAWIILKYGRLPVQWREFLHKGFSECMRVLDDYGTLIFKWNESQIKYADIIKAIGYEPIITQRTGKQNKTIWMCFMKIPIV